MHPSYDLTIVSCGDFMQIAPDDQLLLQALARRDVAVRIADWRDSGVNWQDSRLTLVRSPWDYFQHGDEFARWIDRVAPLSPLINSAAILHWNRHKRYLADLAQKGCPVTPTQYVNAHDAT